MNTEMKVNVFFDNEGYSLSDLIIEAIVINIKELQKKGSKNE